ncbi:MAG: ATP-dependent sacrificial sulfur transferase LarE [Candidatus Omnitrophica bacterium]|nr:ATP-dependent sacrificial sulfur transferase LarE [Candidatus Omnitrophota bacterium]
MALNKKYTALQKKIAALKSAVVAFSGGTDSSVLAKIAFDCLGKKAVAVTAKSATYALNDLKEAKKTAKLIGVRHVIIKTSESKNKNFTNNPLNRCYWCKRELFTRLRKIADKYRIKNILDGTNGSDGFDVRPGFKANKEFNVISPFLERGITKAEIKMLAKKLNIPIKAPNACLASRIPFNEKIIPGKLARIEKAEAILKSYLGDGNLIRCRDHNDILRIEIENKQWTKLLNSGINNLIKKLKKSGYKYITLDLEGYIPAGLR